MEKLRPSVHQTAFVSPELHKEILLNWHIHENLFKDQFCITHDFAYPNKFMKRKKVSVEVPEGNMFYFFSP
jgi:hypothetical protein